MKTFTEERIQEMDNKLNGVLGRLIMPAMRDEGGPIKEALPPVEKPVRCTR